MLARSFLHYIKFILSLDQPDTQTTKKEQVALIRYASKSTNAIEIGVFEGFNTNLIADAMPSAGILYGIDPFFKGKFGVSWQKLIATRYLKRKQVDSKVRLIETKSQDAIHQIKHRPDFIFVDGDHSLAGIKMDWEIYSDLLLSKGIIALHDTVAPIHQSWKADMDSVKFFDSHISIQPGFELLEIVDSLSILRKL